MASYSNEFDVEKGTGKEIYSVVDEPVTKPFRTEAAVANPAPLGLTAFALTTFVLSCHNAGFFISQSASHSLVIGLALSYGGLAQLLAGMWEFWAGNTFGATVFSSYAAFWFSFAVIQIPGFGVRAAFEASNSLDEFHKALGIWLLGWTIFTFLAWLATLRTNICLTSLFASLLITFLLLTIAEFHEDKNAKRAGGMMGILTAFMAWYLALANVVNKKNSFFELPIGSLSGPSSTSKVGPFKESSKDLQMESAARPVPNVSTTGSRVFPIRSRSFKGRETFTASTTHAESKSPQNL